MRLWRRVVFLAFLAFLTAPQASVGAQKVGADAKTNGELRLALFHATYNMAKRSSVGLLTTKYEHS